MLLYLGMAVTSASHYYGTYAPSTYAAVPPPSPPSYEHAPSYGPMGQHYGHVEHEPCSKHSTVHLPPVRIHFTEPGNVVLEGQTQRVHNDVPQLTGSHGQMASLSKLPSHDSRTSYYASPPTYVPSYAAPPPPPYVPSYSTPPPTTTTYAPPTYGPAHHQTSIMSPHSVQNPLASLLHSAHPHSVSSHHQDIVGAHLDAVSQLTASHDLAHSNSEHAHATRKIAMGHAAAVQALTFDLPPAALTSHHDTIPTGGQGHHIPILRFDEHIEEGKKYSHNFDSGNGIHQQEQTDVQFVPRGPHECDKALITKTGSVSYTSPEGEPNFVNKAKSISS